MRTEEPIVLLVDDSKSDVLLMRAAFGRVGFKRPLLSAANGEDAIAYLLGDGRYGDRVEFPLPAVVLLDLNMPGKNGFEVLEWIRLQPMFRRLCVYILSASGRPEDIARSYDLGANSYLVKPGNLDGLLRMVNCLDAWVRLSHFAPLLAPASYAESASSR